MILVMAAANLVCSCLQQYAASKSRPLQVSEHLLQDMKYPSMICPMCIHNVSLCKYSSVTLCPHWALFAGINLSDPRQFREQLKQELELLDVLPALKRSRTGWQEYSTLPTQDCDEVKLWNAEVLKRNVSSFRVM